MFNHSEKLDQLATALCNFQKAVPGVNVNAENDEYASKYVNLRGIWDTIRKPLTDQGLSVVQLPDLNQGHKVVIETVLLHSSGQFISLAGSLPLDSGSNIHAATSGFTYLQRYALKGMLGLPNLGDDDGNGAAGKKPRQKPPERTPLPPMDQTNGQDSIAPEPIEETPVDREAEPPVATTTADVPVDRQSRMPDDETRETDAGTDFRETRIHFGKNRGLQLSELTPQQVHWYETDWMPKKEVNGPISTEDLALINALKAYRAWRGNSPKLAKREICNDEEAAELNPAERNMQWARTFIPSGKNEGKLLGVMDDDAIGAYYKLLEDKPNLPIFTEAFADALAGWKQWCNTKAEGARALAAERAAGAPPKEEKQSKAGRPAPNPGATPAVLAATPTSHEQAEAAQVKLKATPIAKRPAKAPEPAPAASTPKEESPQAGGPVANAGGPSWKEYQMPAWSKKGTPLAELPRTDLEDLKRDYLDTRKWNDPSTLKPYDAELKANVVAALAWHAAGCPPDPVAEPVMPAGPVADLYKKVRGLIIDPKEFLGKMIHCKLIAPGIASFELIPEQVAKGLLDTWDKTLEAFDSNIPF